MDEIVLKIWYIKEADLLSVSWNDKPSYYTTTDHGRVLADVDMEGNFKGFEVDGVTLLEDGVLEIRIPSPQKIKERAEKLQKSRPSP
jgi:hypothetical protein